MAFVQGCFCLLLAFAFMVSMCRRRFGLASVLHRYAFTFQHARRQHEQFKFVLWSQIHLRGAIEFVQHAVTNAGYQGISTEFARFRNWRTKAVGCAHRSEGFQNLSKECPRYAHAGQPIEPDQHHGPEDVRSIVYGNGGTQCVQCSTIFGERNTSGWTHISRQTNQ